MKKIILVLLGLPLMLVSCAKKNDDGNLQGIWIGQVKSGDVALLKDVGAAAGANSSLTTESLFYKFDSGKIVTYKAKDFDNNNNQTEQEVGTYTANDGVLTINIEAHSCANTNIPGLTDRKLKKVVPYRISEDFTEMTLTLKFNSKVVFKKLESTDADDAQNSVNSSDVGCFAGGGLFKANAVQKPKEEVNLEEVRKIQEEVDEAGLNEEAKEEAE
ncbi:MAG: lipocalin family protein [Bdellovibrionota bacterium]